MEKRKKRGTAFYIISAVIALIILAAVFAPFIAPNDPNEVNLSVALAPFGKKYPLGTDALGRCILSRIIYGARVSVFISLAVTAIVFAAGVLIGVLAGYFGGALDGVLSRLITIMQSFPKIILVIAVAGILGSGVKNIVLALCMVEWVGYARISRSLAFGQRQRTYVKAARVCGESHIRIILKRIIPNIIHPLIVQASLGTAGVIMETAALSYLGVGVEPSTAEWGAMISTGREYLQTNPALVLLPGAAIFIMSALFNMFGEKLRDKMN